MKSIAILGGGLAGLSAAVYLVEAGFQVRLFEARPVLGGRAYSVMDSKTGDVMDNGQHLMMGCYHHTFDFLKKIGRETPLQTQVKMEVPLVERGGKIHRLKASDLPSPLHLVSALFSYSGFSLKEKFNLALFLNKLRRSSVAELKALDSLSCAEWLKDLDRTILKNFLEPLILATLNESPEKASAKLLATVFLEALLKGKEESKMVTSTVGLSDLYTNAAQKFIEDRGGKIFTRCGISSLSPWGRGQGEGPNQIEKLILDNGEEIIADFYLSTLPANALWKILPDALKQQAYFSKLDEVQYSAIYNINLWYEKPWFSEFFAGLLGSPIHWVFNKGRLLHAEDIPKTQYLSLTISAANFLKNLNSQELLALALKELGDFFPQSKNIKPVHHRILKELQATPSFGPGSERLRPEATTPLHNFFLAGDWTSTGLPATIEGAVKSGKMAAIELKGLLNCVR
ncbi:MAG: oleate hydratase [Deltaproteobacteria bacterium]|nr:oleate hydratase [Deltaproteobacteria bacterium]